jgi:hydrogenase-4 component F
MGLAAFAFGLGGATANLAGILHLLGHSVVKSAVFFAVGAAAMLKGSQKMADIGGLATSHPALGWGLALGIAALAGMPPGALFVSEFALVAEAASRLPWLIPVLGLGLLVAAAALVTALQALCLGAPTPDRPVAGAFGLPGGMLWAILPVWAHLLLAALLGFALPEAIVAMLRDGARILG